LYQCCKEVINMPKHALIFISLIVCLALPAPAFAMFGDGDGERYFALKLSRIDLQRGESSDAKGVTFMFGQYMGERRVAASESELGMSFSDGSVRSTGLTGGSEVDWDMFHISQFVSFQNEGDIRVKARLGFAYTQMDVGGRTEGDFGPAYGVGVIAGPFELELTQMGSDHRFISASFRF
jgi:hypothetical protein